MLGDPEYELVWAWNAYSEGKFDTVPGGLQEAFKEIYEAGFKAGWDAAQEAKQ